MFFAIGIACLIPVVAVPNEHVPDFLEAVYTRKPCMSMPLKNELTTQPKWRHRLSMEPRILQAQEL